MRRLAAIMLWGILLFNWIGYRFLNSFLEDRASRRLEARLDRQQYDENQLITIKVPVTHLAYYNSSATFIRTNGQINVSGIPYQYVASRIYNDSLEMLCIPNTVKLKLSHSDPDTGTHPYVTKAFTDDPFICIQVFGLDELRFVVKMVGYHYRSPLSSLTLPSDERPPACV